jgi:hypothetical protein
MVADRHLKSMNADAKWRKYLLPLTILTSASAMDTLLATISTCQVETGSSGL